jgi:hypothetical protein
VPGEHVLNNDFDMNTEIFACLRSPLHFAAREQERRSKYLLSPSKSSLRYFAEESSEIKFSVCTRGATLLKKSTERERSRRAAVQSSISTVTPIAVYICIAYDFDLKYSFAMAANCCLSAPRIVIAF